MVVRLFSPRRRQAELSFFFMTGGKAVAMRADLNPDHWYLHRFRDTAATRWLRAGIDVRTVQSWLGHESLETTQKYLEPSKEQQNASFARIALPL